MIDAIKSSFENLTPLLWVSQISGLIGLIIIGISYLFKKKKFLLIATGAFIFFILEQAFAHLWSNLIVSSTCFVRNLFMLYFLFRKNKELPRYLLFGFIGIMWVLIISYLAATNSFGLWDNYLPPAIVTMSTITQNNKKELVVKIGALLHEAGFLVYYLIYNLPFSILRQAILVVACLIGLIILIIGFVRNKQIDVEKEEGLE